MAGAVRNIFLAGPVIALTRGGVYRTRSRRRIPAGPWPRGPTKARAAKDAAGPAATGLGRAVWPAAGGEAARPACVARDTLAVRARPHPRTGHADRRWAAAHSRTLAAACRRPTNSNYRGAYWTTCCTIDYRVDAIAMTSSGGLARRRAAVLTDGRLTGTTSVIRAGPVRSGPVRALAVPGATV